MSDSNSARTAPRSACQACYRLKMKCARESSIPSFSCVRCHKAGRVCSPGPGATASRKPTGARATRNTTHSLRMQRDMRRTPKEPDERNTLSFAAGTLPSIYSTSPTSHVDGEYRAQNEHTNRGSNLELKEVSVPVNRYVSSEDAIQLIHLFRERLLPCLHIIQLNSSDFDDAPFLVSNHPDLATCICYVTCTYVQGGYENVRRDLAKPVIAFVQNVFSRKSRTDEDELVTMQALIILYAWAAIGTADPNTRDFSLSEINYWAIKSACEGFAIHANFHRAGNLLKERMKMGVPFGKNDIYARRYLFWIWLFVKSHLVSRVTRTPLTMHADASIRASSKLLNGLSSDPIIEQILGGLELCLLWEKLGKRDNRLAEWWCPLDLEEESDSEEPRVTIKDVNIALENWRSHFSHSFPTDSGTNANNLNLIYHYHYTKFCLNTHFVRRTSSNPPTDREQAEAIIKCVDSVLSIFNLYHTLGPTRRDQLRYFPGFLFVILSFCASFLMKAIQIFPALFPHPNLDLALLRKLAKLMIGLGDSGHEAFISGTLILRHLDEMELPTNQHVESFDGLQPLEGLVISTDSSGSVEPFTLGSSTGFEAPPDSVLRDFTNLFDPMYENEWYNSGSPYRYLT